MISFNEVKHTYTNTETDESYISVTTLLGNYKTPFDKDLHSTRVANREGVPKEMVLEMWSKEAKIATDKGTNIHKVMENYISLGEELSKYEYLYKSYEKCESENIEKYNKVLSEQLLYNHTYRVAGIADLIYDQGNYFTIGDFKTNKKFNFTSSFNDYLLYPVNHLQSCEFNNYALQLSMYAYLYENMSGKKCKGLVIYHLEDKKWRSYRCNYLKLEAEIIFKDYMLNHLK